MPRRAGEADRGSSPAEFVLVAALLTVLTLTVLQLALALHVRNTVLDAAAEGARYGSFADTGLDAGAARTRDLITVALGSAFATDVTATYASDGGYPTVRMRVVAPLPLLGLLGPDRSLEVVGRAVVEGSG
jgi:Flp pilus assembly protein TadG